MTESSTKVEVKVTAPGEGQTDSAKAERTQPLFTEKTQCIIWGMQQRAVQGMLDFDYVCSRCEPSVVAMIYPFTSVLNPDLNHFVFSILYTFMSLLFFCSDIK